MIVTEEEAKAKWCRHVRHAEAGGGSWNRANWEDGDVLNTDHNNGRFACTCIGAKCMAWRWVGGWSRDDRTGLDAKVPLSKGYCGAEGKP